MAQTIGCNCSQTNTSYTRRAELLWQVLVGAYVQGLVPVKSVIIKVGKMGERPVQKGSHQMAETKV